MTYKAYIDNIRAKTGENPEYFLAAAGKKGLTKHSELLNWLKTEMRLGHGHARAIVFYIRDPEWAEKKIRADAKKENPKSNGNTTRLPCNSHG